MAKHLKKAVADAEANVVEKLTAARARVELLESYQESLKQESDSWMNESHKWAAIAAQREKELAELRDRLGDLKQKHLDALLQKAEREGYIGRVLEQDSGQDRTIPPPGALLPQGHAKIQALREAGAESFFGRDGTPATGYTGCRRHWTY